jgi:uncharacterized metal-binding protein
MMTLYSLIKKRNTDELHLFNSKKILDKCNVEENISICKKMNFSEKGDVVFACNDENEARIKCAQEGRKVCGICVGTLYTTE